MIDLKQLAELLERDDEGRKRIADILAREIAIRSRKILVESALKEVATKDDLEKMSKELKEYVDLRVKSLEDKLSERINGLEDKLNERINSLEIKIDSLEKRLDMLARFTFATFIGIILTLVSVILTRFL